MLNFGLHAFGYEEVNTSESQVFNLKYNTNQKQMGHKVSYVQKIKI
jgi:hypothetical protein